jgi:hypothetical protein
MSVSKLTAENCRDNALESKATGLAEMMDSAVHIATVGLKTESSLAVRSSFE